MVSKNVEAMRNITMPQMADELFIHRCRSMSATIPGFCETLYPISKLLEDACTNAGKSQRSAPKRS